MIHFRHFKTAKIGQKRPKTDENCSNNGGILEYSSQVMVNNVSVIFNTALLRELCMIHYLPRGLASAAEFF